jgi:UDP-N-acetylglucosamine diphosphorylase/glucosamine-1-phosphate N-acetyltransferase
MNAALVVFEDSNWRDLRPLTDVLPVPALAMGASTLLQRWKRAARLPLLGVTGRPEVIAAWGAPPADPRSDGCDVIVSVNAAAVPGPWFERVLEHASPARFTVDGILVAVRMQSAWLRDRGSSTAETADLPEVAVEAPRLVHPWDFVSGNRRAIEEDLTFLAPSRESEVHAQAVLLGAERVAIRRGARVDPGAVLDAREGPILIEEGAKIQSHTLVIGPCVVGARTELLGGVIARSTIGPDCRIAGEVDECIWQGYANKRHHGFLGHSIVGEWVNLGALTTTSDLKNNYGSVRVWVDGQERDSGSSKVGSFFGAHVKTGIGSLLPTGASIGVGSNLFGGGSFAPKYVPAFSWWDGERTVEHRVDAFLATARIAHSRRQRTMTAAGESLLRSLHANTADERRTADRLVPAHPSTGS